MTGPGEKDYEKILSQIQPPQAPSDAVTPRDELLDEEAEVAEKQKERRTGRSAGERADYHHDLLTEQFNSQIDFLKAERERYVERDGQHTEQIDRLQQELRSLCVENARVKQSHKSMRFSIGLVGVGIGVGGSLISQFASSGGHSNWAYFGWGIVVVVALLQLIKTFFDAG